MQSADRIVRASATSGDPTKSKFAEPWVETRGGGPSKTQPHPAVFVSFPHAPSVLQVTEPPMGSSGGAFPVMDQADGAGEKTLPSKRRVLRVVHMAQRIQRRTLPVMPVGGRQSASLKPTTISVKGVSAAM